MLFPIDIAAILMTGISVFIIARAIFMDEEQFKASEVIEEAESSKKSEFDKHGFILKYSRPFFKRYFTPIVEGMKGRHKIRDRYKRKLANAGLTEIMTPDDFYAFKLFLIIGFPIVFLVIREFLEEDWPMMFVFVVSALGFYYPNMWLSGKIEKRNNDVTLGMPFVVDMLALSIEAGLDFVAAIQRVIEKSPPGAITDEFKTFIKEIRIGASRQEALRNLAWRVDLITMASFCATLIAADQVGASVGPLLKKQSEELRQKRSALAEKAGATAATKMLLPMILIVLPAVIIMIAVPFVIDFMGSNK